MARACVARHGCNPAGPNIWTSATQLPPGGVDVGFFDGHVEYSRLPKLWDYTWHKNWGCRRIQRSPSGHHTNSLKWLGAETKFEHVLCSLHPTTIQTCEYKITSSFDADGTVCRSGTDTTGRGGSIRVDRRQRHGRALDHARQLVAGGPPGTVDTALFGNTALTNNAGAAAADNILAASRVIQTLLYTNNTGFHNTLLNPGVTLTISNSAAGDSLFDGGGINVATTNTISGTGGAFIVTNTSGNINVRHAGSGLNNQRATLDLSVWTLSALTSRGCWSPPTEEALPPTVA